MIDIINQINATHREIGTQPVATGAGRSLLLRRSYSAPIEDVWNACTDPTRISRWLAPISGDLRLGGTYQLEGNAGGKILRCDEPRLLKVTWSMGEGMDTEVEVRLSPAPRARQFLSWNTRPRPRSSTRWCAPTAPAAPSASAAAGISPCSA